MCFINILQVEDVMRSVDRGNYCSMNPYKDSPQTIGYRATISAPHMHAHALEMLQDNLHEGSKVLDVGSGNFSAFISRFSLLFSLAQEVTNYFVDQVSLNGNITVKV